MKKRIVKAEQSNEFKIFRLDISQISLLISNIILLIGVIFFNLTIVNYLLLLWLESIIIGFFTLLKMFFAYSLPKKIIFPIFFIIHYGCLAGFLGIFCIDMFYSILYNNNMPIQFSFLFSSFYLILIPLIAIFLSHGISFYKNFILKKEYKRISISQLMIKPYYRIGILYLIYFLSLIIFFNFKLPVLSLIFIILIKIIFDFYSHNKEHNTPIFYK